MPDRGLPQTRTAHAIRYQPICIILAILGFLSFTGGLLTTFGPLSRLRESGNQIQAIDRIDNSITELGHLANRLLTVEYNEELSTAFIQMENQFQNAVSAAIVSGLDEGISTKLNELNNATVPRLMVLNHNIESLNLTDQAARPGSGQSLLERSFLENGVRWDSANLEDIVDEMSYLVTGFVSDYRSVTQEARQYIFHTTEKAFRSLYFSIIFYPASLVFLLSILALRGLRNARAAEIEALERSENLELLIQKRTFHLEQQNRELSETRSLLVEREKLAALGGLVAGVAHEVNTPLGVSVTAASFLADLSNENPEKPIDRDMLRETSELILANLRRASSLINGFKRVAVDESGEMVRQFDLVEYLSEDLLPSLKHLLQKSGHETRLSGVKSMVMKKNPGDFAQIVTNLVINAAVHGYGPDTPGYIEIQVESENNEGLLIVSDSGKGMGPTTRNHMYDPFFTTNRKEGGSGLGLMLVYNLVNQKLKGRIECNTALGEGSRFTIRFPL